MCGRIKHVNDQNGASTMVIDSIQCLRNGKAGKSNDVIQDDVFRRLSACHNVLFTGHQAFLTAEALTAIAQTTLNNLRQLAAGKECPNTLV